MRHYLIAFTILVFSATLGIQPQQALSQTEQSNPNSGTEAQAFAPGRIIVKAEEEAPANAVESLNRETEASIEERLPVSGVEVVDLPRDLSVAEAVERYESSPDIEYAEPDYEVEPSQSIPMPKDPEYSKLHGLNNTGQYSGTVGADISAPEAWSITTGNVNTVVAVIDTGVDINHMDLKNNIWVNEDEIPGNGTDDDNNGYVDDVNGWDFRNEDNTVFDADENPHGTHVAGTIAAEGDNGIGVTGVSWRTKVMSLKFIGPESGYTSDAVEALNYAVKEGVKISNNSWGGGGYSRTLEDALDKADAAGHLFVAAAGNEAADTDATPHYPSSYDSPNVISVANTDNNDLLKDTSNFGATSVDLAAPGKWIYSTLPNNTYGYKSGTSMATPHVSGVAALVKSQNPELSDEQIKAQLLNSVDKKASLDGRVLTGGRLNAARAVGADTTKPKVSAVRPTGRTKDRTPVLAATVRDDGTDLAKSDIHLYVDGSRKGTFSYSSTTDLLSYRSGKLTHGKHTVRIIVEDEAGNAGDRSWKLRVI